MSEASEADILESLEDSKPDTSEVWKRLSLSHDDRKQPHSNDSTSEDSVSDNQVLQKSTSATLPSHVKLLVNELESRYSTGVSRPTQPPPVLQSCPKIATLRDTLLSRVQDPGTSKIMVPTLENCRKVTALRDSLVAKTQVPATSKVSPPTLQSSPKITDLQKTLISRVQDTGASQKSKAAEVDLTNCPSVASRQNTLLHVARHSPAQKQTISTSFRRLRSEPFNHQHELEDGLPNSVDGLETDRLEVVQSGCQDMLGDGLSVRGKEPGDVLPNGRDELKQERQDRVSNSVEEDELLNCGDMQDYDMSYPRNLVEKPEDGLHDPEPGCVQSVCGDITETASSNYRAVPDNSSGPHIPSAADDADADASPDNELLVSESTDDCLTFVQLPSDADE